MVRLLAGDPFVHGSAPEEAQACVKAGVGVEVVPGVPEVDRGPRLRRRAADPPRHRPGQRACNVGGRGVDWSAHGGTGHPGAAVRARPTCVPSRRRWWRPGASPETPVAVTSGGTTTAQRTLVSTLDQVAADVAAAGVTAPAVVVVGAVVELRDTLSWFETRPLFGWRVLVPRTKEQAGDAHRPAARATAPSPRRCRRSRSSRRATRSRWTRRSAAWSRAATSGSASPPSTRCRRRPREVRRVRPGRPRVLGAQDRRRRRGHRRSDRHLGHQARPGAVRRAVGAPACSTTGRRSTRCSTRSTGCSCPGPTSPPRRWWPGWWSSAGRSTT